MVYLSLTSSKTRPMSLIARSGAVFTVTSLKILSNIAFECCGDTPRPLRDALIRTVIVPGNGLLAEVRLGKDV